MATRRLAAALGMLCSLLLGGCLAPSPAPIAAFTYTPLAGESPLIVTFDASGSHAPGGAIVEYRWEFGDGSSGLGMTLAHAFQTPEDRTFLVTLQVTDQLQQKAVSSATIPVSSPRRGSELASIEFIWPFHYDASGDDALNLNDEYFVLENKGFLPVDMSGWTVENERGAAFRFPAGTVLLPHAVVYVHSGSGMNTEGVLYWNAPEPMWNDTSDLAVLRDSEGTIMAIHAYHAC